QESFGHFLKENCPFLKSLEFYFHDRIRTMFIDQSEEWEHLQVAQYPRILHFGLDSSAANSTHIPPVLMQYLVVAAYMFPALQSMWLDRTVLNAFKSNP